MELSCSLGSSELKFAAFVLTATRLVFSSLCCAHQCFSTGDGTEKTPSKVEFVGGGK